MDNNTMIEILIAAGSTTLEAKKHIDNGAMIYRANEKDLFVKNCLGCLIDQVEAVTIWGDLTTVNFGGDVYKIDYVL